VISLVVVGGINDRTVSVVSMKLQEIDDFVMLNSGHAMMRFNNEVQVQIRNFLATGEFQRSPEASPVNPEQKQSFHLA